MLKKVILTNLILMFLGTSTVFAEEPQVENQFDKNKCDKKADELKTLQSIMFELKSGDESLHYAQASHDKDMAELIVLKGIKELKERHKKFLRDVTSPNASSISTDLNKINQFRGQLRDGIDVMGRMMVFQNMIDEIIDIESEMSGDEDQQLKSKVRRDPKELKNLLSNKCSKKTIQERVMHYPLCSVILPPKRSDYKDIPKAEKELLKAKVESLNGFSPNLEAMIEGFANAYIVKHPSAENQEQRAQKRLESLRNYKELLRGDFPSEFQPENLYNDTVRLHQKLVAAQNVIQQQAGKTSTDDQAEIKTKLDNRLKTLNQIKSAKEAEISLQDGLENYKKCMEDLRFRALSEMDTSAKVVIDPADPFAFKKRDRTAAELELGAGGELPPINSCELQVSTFKCASLKKFSCRKDTESPDKTIAEAGNTISESIQGFQNYMSNQLKSSINKYVDYAVDGDTQSGEKVQIGDASNEKSNSMFSFDDLSGDESTFQIDNGKQKQIELSSIVNAVGEDKKLLNNQFKGFLSSLNLFNDRRALLKNVVDPNTKDLDANKTFLQALQKVGCLKRNGQTDFNLNDPMGLENAVKHTFSNPEAPADAGSEKFLKFNKSQNRNVSSYETKDANIVLNPEVLKRCFDDSANLDNKIAELENSVMARKNIIAKIKSTDKYKNLNQLKILQLQRYQKFCSKQDTTGFQRIGRCRLDYNGNKSTEQLDTFISHNGNVVGILALNEINQVLPNYIKDLRATTAQMKQACEDHRERLPEICTDAENRHYNAMRKTPNEKTKELHEKYHITYTSDGEPIYEKKKSMSSVVASEVARGVVQYGVPTWAQYEMNKSQMEYNTAMGYNMKINQYLLDNPGTYIYGIGGYDPNFGYSGYYPFSSFGYSMYGSPFLNSPIVAGTFQYNYLTAQ